MKIGFIDFSKEERNKVMATLKLLTEQGSIDELGISTIRDAYAEILFPGMSTVQTRAKYFVMIPYFFEIASRKEYKNGKEFLKEIEKMEERIIGPLLKNSKEDRGIIGVRAKSEKREVKRKPSAIYWNGLKTFNILKNDKLSFSTACNLAFNIQNEKRKIKSGIIKKDESYDDITAGNGHDVIFSPIHPEYDVEKNITIELTKKEAEFLKHKITSSSKSKESMLAFLIKNELILETINDIPIDILPDKLKYDFILAKNFADFIYGAHIRYNMIFSNYTDNRMLEKYNDWQSEFIKSEVEILPVLKRVNADKAVSAFCVSFFNAVHKNDTKTMDELIINREKSKKGTRAKLLNRAEYRYEPENPIHDYKLNFRFNNAKTIIKDILAGLEDTNV